MTITYNGHVALDYKAAWDVMFLIEALRGFPAWPRSVSVLPEPCPGTCRAGSADQAPVNRTVTDPQQAKPSATPGR